MQHSSEQPPQLLPVCLLCANQIIKDAGGYICPEHGKIIENELVIFKANQPGRPQYVRRLQFHNFLRLCPYGEVCKNENCWFAKNESEQRVWKYLQSNENDSFDNLILDKAASTTTIAGCLESLMVDNEKTVEDLENFLKKLNNLESFLSEKCIRAIFASDHVEKKKCFFKFAKGDLLLDNETLFKILLKDYLDDFVKYTGYFKVNKSTVDYLVDNNEIEIFKKLVVEKGVTGVNLYSLYERLPNEDAWKFAWLDLFNNFSSDSEDDLIE